MDTPLLSYKRHRFSPAIITHAVRLYCWSNLSFREVEELLLLRGIAASYETIRRGRVARINYNSERALSETEFRR